MSEAAQRIVDRWAYTKRTKGVPVLNKDTDRTVYVLPETLQKEPDRFEKVPPDTVGDPRWRGKPKPPSRPAKPVKPEVPRDPPPAPVRPQIRKRKVKLVERVPEIPQVEAPKVPVPSKPHRWKKVKPITASAVAIVDRYLASLQDDRLRGSCGR